MPEHYKVHLRIITYVGDATTPKEPRGETFEWSAGDPGIGLRHPWLIPTSDF